MRKKDFDSKQFNAIVQDLRQDFSLGHIQKDEAMETLQEVMRDFGMLDCDEELVDLPENFRSTSGYIGEFRVKHERSPYTWNRSYGLECISDAHFGPVVGKDVIVGDPPYQIPTPTPLNKSEKDFFAQYEQEMIPLIGFEKKPFTTDI